MEDVQNVHANVEADEVSELERTHGMVHAQLHDGIHGLGGGDAFHDAVSGFVDERHENAVGDEARRVVDGDRLLIELFGELHSGPERGVAGLQSADDFDEDHDGHGIHEVHADETVGALGERGERRDGDRRGVSGEDHFGAENVVGFLEDGALDFEFLGDGFDNEIGAGNGGHAGDGLQAGENGGAAGFRDFALLDFAVEIFADGFEGGIEKAPVNIAQNDVVAGAREDVGDAVAHSAGAEDGDGLDRVGVHEGLLKLRR